MNITSTLAAANSAPMIPGRYLRSFECIAHVADRGHDVGAQLAAQPADADVDDVRLGIELTAPDLAEQLLARADIAAAEHEVAQQLELTPGQADRAAAGVGGASVEVDLDAGDPLDARRRLAGRDGRAPQS